MKPVLVGAALFVVATSAMTLLAGSFSGWEAPTPLPPLSPQPAETAPPTPSMPIRSQNLTIRGGTTQAVLTMPRTETDVAVVLIAGSGQSNRQDLLPLARRFARAGIAALTYDKRSDGYTALQRDYQQLADDAIAGVDAVAQATGIPRIGIFGVSEGGWVATAAAGRSQSPVSFVVLASAPVVSPLAQISWTVDATISHAPPVLRGAAATVLAGGRVFAHYLDSTPSFDGVDAPILAVWGADDASVPVNAAYRALPTGNEISAHIVGGVGHDLLADPDPWFGSAVAWIDDPSDQGLVGHEPVSAHGVATPHDATWFIDPRVHLAVSLTLALAGSLISRRRNKSKKGMPD